MTLSEMLDARSGGGAASASAAPAKGSDKRASKRSERRSARRTRGGGADPESEVSDIDFDGVGNHNDAGSDDDSGEHSSGAAAARLARVGEAALRGVGLGGNRRAGDAVKRKHLEDMPHVGEEGEFSVHASAALAASGDATTEGGGVSMDDLLRTMKDTPAYSSLRRRVEASGAASSTGALPVPSSEIVQSRADRQVAYEYAKEDMSEVWQPKVKKLRETEHLSFPLNPVAPNVPTSASLVARHNPETALELDIETLLAQSGAGSERSIVAAERRAIKAHAAAGTLLLEQRGPNGEDDDGGAAAAAAAAEAAADPVRAAELAKSRDLLFFYEQRRRRAAKIKSKQYHKVLKRKRQRDEKRELQALAGVQ
jgi:U3 small nucleolar RNA-associated protein 14